MGDTTTISTNGHAAATPDRAAAELVERFLRLLEAGDVDAAADLLAEDVDYTNVSLPTIRGREAVRRMARATLGRGASFEVHFHAVSARHGVVLTERTDVLSVGPVRTQFWVCGRFEVRDGEITVWRDYFDWANITVALVRGLLGAVVPPLRARAPRSAG